MCPNASVYSLEFLTSRKHGWRCVAFLVSSHERLLARAIFRGLRENEQRRFRANFDNWCARVNYPKGYHGWNKSEFDDKYKECFVFKGREGQSQLRLYGFLIHPDAKRPRFELCVLADHAYKNTHKTDLADLGRVEKLRTDPEVKAAIIAYFRE